MELSNEIGNEYRKGYIGKSVKVLVEEKEEEKYKGHTSNYIYVEIENAKQDITNRIVEVNIKLVNGDMLIRRISLRVVYKPERRCT